MASLSEAVIVRPYRAGDEAAINEASNEVFGLERKKKKKKKL